METKPFKLKARTRLTGVPLAVALVLSCVAWPCLADGPTLTVSPQTLHMQPSSRSTLTVQVAGIEGLYGFELELSFDPQVIQVIHADTDTSGVQVEPGDFLSEDFVVRNRVYNDTGKVQYAITQVNPSLPRSGSGTLFSLTVLGASAGTSEVGVTGLLANRDADVLAVTIQPAQVSVGAAGQQQGSAGTSTATATTQPPSHPTATPTAAPATPTATATSLVQAPEEATSTATPHRVSSSSHQSPTPLPAATGSPTPPPVAAAGAAEASITPEPIPAASTATPAASGTPSPVPTPQAGTTVAEVGAADSTASGAPPATGQPSGADGTVTPTPIIMARAPSGPAAILPAEQPAQPAPSGPGSADPVIPTALMLGGAMLLFLGFGGLTFLVIARYHKT